MAQSLLCYFYEIPSYLVHLRFDDSERSIKELAVNVLMNKVSDPNNDIRLRQVENVYSLFNVIND